MADKSPKTNKLKARLPRGLADRGPAEIAATRAMTQTIRTTFERYGFEALETPAIEYTDALGKFLPDQDRPNEGVFSFQDDDEQWLSLRYDLTAPLARHVAENFQNIALPFRSYREGYVFRNEKPGPGRFRQFLQFDADTVGSASMAADAEMCMLAADTMEELGIKRGDYVVKIGSRKVLDGILESVGVVGAEDLDRRLRVLRAIDKIERLGKENVALLLGPGRKDESGDFTSGANLTDEQVRKIINFTAGLDFKAVVPDGEFSGHEVPAVKVESGGSIPDDKFADEDELGFEEGNPFADTYWSNSKLLQIWETMVGSSLVGRQAIQELEEMNSIMRAAGYGSKRVEFSSSVVRGLEYYTGPVYEIELLIETKDEKGRPVRFGSVGGGGRYDGLVSRFRGEPVPATGFSIGVSRLQAALTLIGKLDGKSATGPVIVTVFDKDRTADYQAMVAQLRNAGIRAELYLGNPKHSVGQQLKYADKRSSPCAIIQGPDEKAKGEVTIKDLRLGAELAGSDKDRAAHLEKQAQAQLVEEVKKILGAN
jgi:histidyl-tRNA synthetase